MQPQNARRRASLRFARYDSATGRPKRGWFLAAAGLALALVVGSGMAVASASSAEAHDQKVTADCTGIDVELDFYNTEQGINTLTIDVVDGNSYDIEFEKKLVQHFEFSTPPDPTRSWTYTLKVDAKDGKNGTEWDYEETKTVKPCATPDISLTATRCDTAGDLSQVEALFDKLDGTHSYTVELTSNGGSSAGPEPVDTTNPKYTWQDIEPGYDYTATLTDETTNISASATVHAIGCPKDTDFAVSIDECTTPGGNGKYNATISGLVAGREYTVAFVNVGGATNTLPPFTAPGGDYPVSFDASPSGSYYVTVTDSVTGVTKPSETKKFLPCPDVPKTPTLSVVQCTSTDGVSDGTFEAYFDGMVPGRSYTVSITSGSATLFTQDLPFTTRSDFGTTLTGLAPGTYTATITDVTSGSVTGFTASATADVAECPKQQDVGVEAQQCSVPGGTGTLIATVTNFVVGRAYTVEMTPIVQSAAASTSATAVTAALPAPQTFTPMTTDPVQFTFTDLTPGQYRVIVTDVLAPNIIAAGDVVLKDCPGNPDIELGVTECTTLAANSTVTVELGKLVAGETYTVSLTGTASGEPVDGVPSQQVSGDSESQKLTFGKVPNGRNYTVTVENVSRTLTATATILLKTCKIELPTLAYTGASTMTPTVAGIGFLQFGLVLVGISLVKRRSGAREV